MTYRPVPSVVALLDFSISTGLAASTTTPGSTAPDGSRATPVSEAPACAKAVHGTIAAIPVSNAILNQPRMSPSFADKATVSRAAPEIPVATAIPLRHNLRRLVLTVQYIFGERRYG